MNSTVQGGLGEGGATLGTLLLRGLTVALGGAFFGEVLGDHGGLVGGRVDGGAEALGSRALPTALGGAAVSVGVGFFGLVSVSGLESFAVFGESGLARPLPPRDPRSVLAS